MAHAVENDAKKRMEKTLEAFRQELTTIRTGRASVGLLDVVEVDVYGSRMKINQLGTIAAPEPRLIVITPWDKTQINAIEKAIKTSPLELNPSNDGRVIRLPIPALTEERRKDLVKLTGKLAEEARVSVRNIRRQAVDEVKTGQKDGEIPEDDAHKLTGEIQNLTDDYITKIDDALKAKEAEIMEV